VVERARFAAKAREPEQNQALHLGGVLRGLGHRRRGAKGMSHQHKAIATFQGSVQSLDVPVHCVAPPRLRRTTESEEIDQEQTMRVGERCDPALPVSRRPAHAVEKDQQWAALPELLVAQHRHA